MPYKRTEPTNWNKFQFNRPSNPFIKWFYFDVELRAYRSLLKYASFSDHPSILELGSASGYITKKLSLILNSKNVVLVDSNESMLSISKKTFRDAPVNAEFVEGDFFKYDFKETFDLVHSGGVIEHFEPEKQFQLAKIHADLLAPGGYCIIFVPSPTPVYRFVRKIIELLHLWNYTDEIPMTESELIEMVEKTGLRVLASTYFWKHYWLSEVGVIAKKIYNQVDYC
jgi:SAM-dependent methyltransferase